MGEFLLDRCDAAGIFAFQHIFDLLWERERQFLHDLAVLDDIDGDVVIDEAQDVEVERVDVALDF